MKYHFKKIGNDVIINDNCVIVRPELVEIGSHISIDMWVYISTQLHLGDYIHIAPHVSIIGGASRKLIMENFTSIGSGTKVVIGGDDFNSGMINPTIPIKHRIPTSPTEIVFKNYSTVGVNCTILPGVTLSEGSVIGANSLVTKDTEPWVIYGGSPARPLKKRSKDMILKSARELGYE